jgi:glycosyltransferase involved in cell wall biosynthesis
MRRILLNTYPSAFILPGGGERNLIDIYNALFSENFSPTLYDPWNPRLEEADIVHYFSTIPGSGYFCRNVKDLGIPLVISPNLWITEETAAGPYRDLLSEQLQYADKIVVNSHIESEHYRKIFKHLADKIEVVHVGLPSAFLEKTDPSIVRNFLKLQSPFILCTASFHPRKNHFGLIQAMKAFPDHKILFFGEIRDEVYAAKCFKEGGEQVIYAGSIPHTAPLLRSAYAACDAFVLPSSFESPSISALEAAAQGAEVIVTKFGSSMEYFGDYAQYIDPNDINDISAKISYCLNQKRKEDVSKFVTSRFNISHSVKSLAEIYKSLR